ncbi:MAG: alpha/beta hydrolase-fold protein [Thermoanaerobaculia bacterium]|nr:alpha/beta hydrolase-fold protein [Thermoanaerobaculia bacterium]
MTRPGLASLSAFLLSTAGFAAAAPPADPAPSPLRISVSFPKETSATPVDGRVLLMVSTDASEEPRKQINIGLKTQQIFGIDVDGLPPGIDAVFDATVLGYPLESLAGIPKGTYFVQAVLHKYETFHRADGHTVKLPMDRGEGQHWNVAPGNLYSTPKKIDIDPSRPVTIPISLDKVIPPIRDPATTKWVRHERIRSERLSKFWGRDMFLGAHVLLPLGFDEHPHARYPFVIFHGHFSETFEGFREEPPDPNLKPDFSERFRLAGYNRIQQAEAHQLYKDWTSPGFPRAIVVEIQHANPYYDDSYAVNSANLGPYGDAIEYELIPYLEKKYRALGAGWARFAYGGSTGGWEAMAVQIFYPDDYNGAYVACPDPIDFRAYTVIDIYKDENAYFPAAPWKRVPRPAQRDAFGTISATVEDTSRLELVLGTKGRSGEQWDIWQAVYSPVGADGHPKPIWDKRTGVIDKDVAAYWKERYDLTHILKRDWDKGLGKKLEGKLHIFVGEADNYYLNNAVVLAEEFLKGTKNPHYGGTVDYEPRAEHCWNGDHTRPNAISRLRYHQMFLPRIVERIRKTAPAGADLKSWNY